MSSTANRILKNTGWLYLKMAFSMIVSLITTRIILQSLGASDFGIFNIVGGAIGMLGFINAALASATQRYMSFSEGNGNLEKKKVIFNVSIVLHTIISIIVLFVLVIAGFIFFKYIFNIPIDRVVAAIYVYCCFIVSTVFTVMSVPYDAVMNAHENMRYYALVGILESSLKLFVAFVCAYTMSDKLVVYGVLMAGISIIVLIILRIYCHTKYEECVIKPTVYFRKKDAKEISKFAGWNIVGCMTSFIGNYGQGILLNVFFGVIVNAALGIVQQLQGQLLLLSNNLLKALNPVIVKSEGNNNRLSMIMWSLRGCKFSYVIVAWAVIPLFLEANYVLELWLKDVPDYTVLFFRLQMIRFLIEQCTICLSTSLSAVGEIKKVNLQSAIFSLMPLLLCYVLFNHGFSPYWLFILFIIVVTIQGALKISLCNQYCNIGFMLYFKKVFLPVLFITLISVSFGSLSYLIFDRSFCRLIMTCLLSLLGLILSSRFFFFDNQENAYIFNLIYKLKEQYYKMR